jgi:hypothetical protein
MFGLMPIAQYESIDPIGYQYYEGGIYDTPRRSLYYQPQTQPVVYQPAQIERPQPVIDDNGNVTTAVTSTAVTSKPCSCATNPSCCNGQLNTSTVTELVQAHPFIAVGSIALLAYIFLGK